MIRNRYRPLALALLLTLIFTAAFLHLLQTPGRVHAQPLVAPDVTAQAAPCRAISLTWSHDPAYDGYEIWRGYAPTFTPGDDGSERVTTLPPPASGNTLTYEEWYVTGRVLTNTFYVVRALESGGGSADAAPVGEFDFPLNGTAATEFHLFCITVPTTLADGQPLPGAGNIEVGGTSDTYRFLAGAGDALFVDFQDHSSDLNVVDFRLTDPDGSILANRCLGCGDPGTVQLPLAGPYRIQVGNPAGTVTGTYQIGLNWVPAPEVFALGLPGEVYDGWPAPGAGNISLPGAHDIYTFTAPAGQKVFIDVRSFDPDISLVDLQLHDSNGTRLAGNCLGCGDPGTVELVLGGTYSITVGGPADDGAGSYEFHLIPVPDPEVFALGLPGEVYDGWPAPGAGNISVGGAHDVYTFSAPAGQKVFIDVRSFDPDIALVDLQLHDSSGTQLAGKCLGCGDPGTVELVLGGTYSITVGSPADDGAGSYEFHLIPVPDPELFNIAIGDTVSDGMPEPGAGHISLPGAHDVYAFAAPAGQEIVVDVQAFDGALGLVEIRLHDSTPTELAATCLGCGDLGPLSLTLGGTYTITVGDPGDDGSGTYEFHLQPVP